MTNFKVYRKFDKNGKSGIGHVIDGVIFDNGKVVISWVSEIRSIVVFDSWDDFVKIHIANHWGTTVKKKIPVYLSIYRLISHVIRSTERK